MNCYICNGKEDVKHLPLYINGSEGVILCMSCRMVLTDLIKDIARATTKKTMEAIKRMKRGEDI